MDDCITEWSEDVLFECANAPKKGISNSNALVVNYNDIDRAASTQNGETVTDVVLKAGAVARKISWYKDLANAQGTFVPNTEDVDGFTHAFLTRFPNSSAAVAARAHEAKNGLFVLFYETKFKGTDSKDAFKIAGWESGLRLSELTSDTNENSGAPTFVLTTEEGSVEQYPYHVFLEGDDAVVTAATFASMFATV